MLHSKKNDEFCSKYKNDYVRGILMDTFESANYDPCAGIPRRIPDNTGLMTTGDRYTSKDYLSGIYRGVGFIRSDAEAEEAFRDENGKLRFKTVFRGTWTILKLNKQISGTVQVFTPDFEAAVIMRNTADGGKTKKTEFENVEFNNKFRVYATSTHDAFYIMTPQVMEALIRLYESMRCPLMMIFSSGLLQIAADTQRSSFEPRLFSVFEPEAEERRIKEAVSPICDTVNELKLYNDIFIPKK